MTVLGAVFLPTQPPEQLRSVAQAADSAGLDELWLWEDCFEQGGIAATAAALASTERLRVGIGVLPVPLRNPALAAMEIASLHRMFPGRALVGVGHGVLDWMAQTGARVESPMTLLGEYLGALRALLGGESVTVEGRYVRLRDVRLNWPPTAPAPVHVAATGPKSIALAGRSGDGLVLTASTTLEALRTARTIFDAERDAGAAPGRITLYLAARGDAEAVTAEVARYGAAGADAVVLQPTSEDDPVCYVRFVAEQVRPRLG
jgi:alkanesulfonate monooxygenase SsuD/methylene tetrahydromethanopterin reductase-like flavin-dependent oxidoreductase (luciferase family)